MTTNNDDINVAQGNMQYLFDKISQLEEENQKLRYECKLCFNFSTSFRDENQQLKVLLKDCQQSFRGIKAQIEEYEYSMARKTAQVAIDEIGNAIGEKDE